MRQMFIITCIAFCLHARAQDSTASQFAWQKQWIDSIAHLIDTSGIFQKRAVSGTIKNRKYHATCYYDKPTKQIVKTTYRFTDSTGAVTAYYQYNLLIKIIDKNISYYAAWQQILNEQGVPVDNESVKSILIFLGDTWMMHYNILMK